MPGGVIPAGDREIAVLVNDLRNRVAELVTLVNELKADYNAHVHSGVTAGAANTGAADQQVSSANATALTAPALVEPVTD